MSRPYIASVRLLAAGVLAAFHTTRYQRVTSVLAGSLLIVAIAPSRGAAQERALAGEWVADGKPDFREHSPYARSSRSLIDTVHVAPPTGDQAKDRTSILAALDAAEPGGTVQFARGTYVVGPLVPVTTPDITLVGHPDGTTLRGCAPEAFEDVDAAIFACNGLELRGARQNVHGLTFEYMWHGLFVGCCFPATMAQAMAGGSERRDQPGGHVVAGNTFRNSSNGLRMVGQSAEPVVIRDNQFRNTFHALVVNGGNAHVLDNDVSVPAPEQVPVAAHAGGAIIVAPLPPAEACGRNVIAGNRIDGHTDGIQVSIVVPGVSCRHTEIRGNTVISSPLRYTRRWDGIRFGDSGAGRPDSTLIGVPIAVTNAVAHERIAADSQTPAGVLDSTVIEGNIITGGSGLGIEVLHPSGNRIAGNAISGIERRDPFPGNTVNSTDPASSGWQDVNGAGIWISARSRGNEIARNTIENVAGPAIALDGDGNRVVRGDSGDVVRDRGRDNLMGAMRAPPQADHHLHLQTAELFQILEQALRATGQRSGDEPPMARPDGRDVIEALDTAGLTFGLVISGGYMWGSPLLPAVLGIQIDNERERVRSENEYVAEQVAPYRDRLVGACSVNPLAEYALEEVALCDADDRIGAFKLHLANAAMDFTDAEHVRRLRAVFDALETANLPVVVHLRNRGDGYGADDTRIFIREVLVPAPGVHVQIAHVAGWADYDDATDAAMGAFVEAFAEGTLDRERITFDVAIVARDPDARRLTRRGCDRCATRTFGSSNGCARSVSNASSTRRTGRSGHQALRWCGASP